MSKDLTKQNGEKGMSQTGAFMPDDFADFLSKGGFASIETIMLGDPKDGKIPFYIGELVGPGASVKVQAPDGTENDLPTWTMHPYVKGPNGIGPAVNVTHVIPASHQVHGAMSRIQTQASAEGKTAIVAIGFDGKVQTKRGRQLNNFKVFEKYVTKAS